MTRIKKKIYTRKPYININIDNENNQQSKNKYIPPFPEETKAIGSIKNVPLAYEPYNDTSYLWRDQSIGQAIRNNIRPPPQYESQNADIPEGVPVAPPVAPPVQQVALLQTGRPLGTILEKKVKDYLISIGALPDEKERNNFIVKLRQTFYDETGKVYSHKNKNEYKNWLKNRYPNLPENEV